MDYCTPCRRPLNGALACPGCGAYAPRLTAADRLPWDAPPAAPMVVAALEAPRRAAFPLTAAAATAPAPAAPFATAPIAPVATAPTPVAPVAVEVLSGPVDPAAAVAGPEATAEPAEYRASSGQGRAARRRRREQLRRSKRRATFASLLALAGGGLTVAAMPTGFSVGPAKSTAAGQPGVAVTTPPKAQPPTATRPDAPRSVPGAAGAEQAAAAEPTVPSGAEQSALTDAVPVVQALPGTLGPTIRATVPPAVPVVPAQPPAAPAAPTTVRSAPPAAPAPAPTTAAPRPVTPAPSAPASTAPAAPAPAAPAPASPAPASPTSPTGSPTAPGQLCVLVVCLG